MRTLTRGPVLAPLTALALLAALVVTGYLVPRGAPPRTAAATRSAAAAGDLEAGAPASRAEVERLIRVFEGRVRTSPTAPDLAYLARLYQQRGKLTGDLATYLAADTALRRARAIAPRDIDVLSGLAASKATLHDFAGARALAQRVLARDVTRDDARVVLVDADVETGRYREARRQLATVAHRVPGAAPVLARQARLAFLTGDVATARRLAAAATKAALDTATFGTSLAYYSLLQGQIELDCGAYDAASSFYRRALRAAPGWHTALAGLARATAASGDLTGAARSYRQAIAVVPQPEYVAGLGDVLAAMGDRAGARAQWATVRAAGRVGAATGQVYNRQLVLYDADHGVDTAAAVRMARAELAVRRDVYGWDALAWALHAAGHDRPAAAASARARASGTQDARVLLHAGLIETARHHDAAARSLLKRGLAISPHVDPRLAPLAARTLASLGGAA